MQWLGAVLFYSSVYASIDKLHAGADQRLDERLLVK
jgi:hypothetical protein